MNFYKYKSTFLIPLKLISFSFLVFVADFFFGASFAQHRHCEAFHYSMLVVGC